MKKSFFFHPGPHSQWLVLWLGFGLLGTSLIGHAREFHVSPAGKDSADGSGAHPLRTIQAAADRAQPGDTITVRAGIYRERIDPPRGGASEDRRIVYQAAAGESVTIKGSEVVKGWEKLEHDSWRVVLPNTFFGDFNPYANLIRGDWFRPKGRKHHTGAVYLDGHWLVEAATLEAVLKPAGEQLQWFATVDDASTTITAQFPGVDPNREGIEINVRQAVFYPSQPRRNFITVRGFTLEHAATNWAPPTAEQVGLIGTHWSKGWIIEDNEIRYSRCTGITLGKYGDEWDNRSQSADAYNRTIERALKNGWNKETIGSHIVRGNHISHCEQAGIVGSMGAAFSEVSNNLIHDINMIGAFAGAEIAGIKFHGPIDTVVKNNHVYRSRRYGIWLDWMTQGARVTGNLAHDNGEQDLFVEVNHGPFVVDNNIFLSGQVFKDWSQGGAYAHNLFHGSFAIRPQGRRTPYHEAHSTEIEGVVNITSGDNRFDNNLLGKPGELNKYDRFQDMTIKDNAGITDVALVEKKDGFYLEFTLPGQARGEPVTTERLGKTRVTKDVFENPDGSPIRIDQDYFGEKRNPDQPAVGPFADAAEGHNSIKVWPRD